MIFLSTVLACLLIGGGTGAIIIGAGMIVLERGWSMVISGSIIATGGFILLGIAMLIRELRRLPERIADALPEESPYLPFDAKDETRLAPRSEEMPSARFEAEPLPSREPSPFRQEPPLVARPHFDDLPKNDAIAEAPSPPADQEISAEAPDASIITNVGATAPDFLVRHDITPLDGPAPSIAPSMPSPTAEPNEISTQHTVADDARSALRIQVSLHNRSKEDTADLASPPIPVVHPERTERESGSFWTRLGKTGKPSKTTSLPPPGPSAAERARERLSLADTPFKQAGEEEQSSAPTLSDSIDEVKPASIESMPASITPVVDIKPVGQEEAADHIADVNTTDTLATDSAAVTGTETKGAKESASETSNQQTSDALVSKNAPPLNTVPAADDTSSNSAPDAKQDTSPNQVVGSYRAGKNVYVMYENGTIEAETPQGIFRFDSLDGLKRYIASGEAPAMAGERIERAPTKVENE